MTATLLGFDFGLKHIGVAIGQTLTRSARPLTSLQAKAGVPNWAVLSALINTWKPAALVVGIPLNMDESEQPITHAARNFAKELEAHYHLPVHLVDERLSTVEARAQLFAEGGYRALSKQAVDQLSAQLILQNWLDAQSSEL